MCKPATAAFALFMAQLASPPTRAAPDPKLAPPKPRLATVLRFDKPMRIGNGKRWMLVDRRGVVSTEAYGPFALVRPDGRFFNLVTGKLEARINTRGEMVASDGERYGRIDRAGVYHLERGKKMKLDRRNRLRVDGPKYIEFKGITKRSRRAAMFVLATAAAGPDLWRKPKTALEVLEQGKVAFRLYDDGRVVHVSKGPMATLTRDSRLIAWPDGREGARLANDGAFSLRGRALGTITPQGRLTVGSQRKRVYELTGKGALLRNGKSLSGLSVVGLKNNNRRRALALLIGILGQAFAL